MEGCALLANDNNLCAEICFFIGAENDTPLEIEWLLLSGLESLRLMSRPCCLDTLSPWVFVFFFDLDFLFERCPNSSRRLEVKASSAVRGTEADRWFNPGRFDKGIGHIVRIL